MKVLSVDITVYRNRMATNTWSTSEHNKDEINARKLVKIMLNIHLMEKEESRRN